MKTSSVECNLQYPKDKDLIWKKATKNGKVEISKLPKINTDATEYNSKNVNKHRGTLEAFL